MENLSIEKRFADIEANLSVIRENIAVSAEKSGRSPSEVRLMAVTKTVEPVFINHAIKCGIDLIGENKVQEFLSKEPYLELEGVECHLIGHLQTNKVRQIVGRVDMIQSLDSIRLAEEISKQSVKNGLVTKCLVEVNVGSEESKSGVPFDQAEALIERASAMEGLKVCGLMAIPPICGSFELRKYFEKMRSLFIDIKQKNVDNDNIDMSVLSMGMSGDYQLAVECGANLVRIGLAVFGPRIY